MDYLQKSREEYLREATKYNIIMRTVTSLVAICGIIITALFGYLFRLQAENVVAFDGPTYADDKIVAALDRYSGLLVFEGEGAVESAYDWVGNSEDVRTIVFREGITSIGEHSFEYPFFPHLERVVFVGDVKEIGDSAFRGHPYLRTVEFWSDVKIGENAFKDCANLETAIPYSSEVAESAFAGTLIEP